MEAGVSVLPPTPPRGELVRDGIPPALLDWHRERARILRDEAIARLGRDFVAWLRAPRPGAPLRPRDLGV